MVLYKKIAEPPLYSSTHHAMFLSLIFKALKKDKSPERVSAFVKRLLQVSVGTADPASGFDRRVSCRRRRICQHQLSADCCSSFRRCYPGEEKFCVWSIKSKRVFSQRVTVRTTTMKSTSITRTRIWNRFDAGALHDFLVAQIDFLHLFQRKLKKMWCTSPNHSNRSGKGKQRKTSARLSS